VAYIRAFCFKHCQMLVLFKKGRLLGVLYVW